MKQQLLDEMLEAIWIAHEEGASTVADIEIHCPHDLGEFKIPDCLKEMESRGLVKIANDRVDLTEEGSRLARNLIRRHRLAQRLLMDVLDVSERESEKLACEFEHILSEEVTDKVAAFLGQPTFDPNGRPIPPGDNPVSHLQNGYISPLITRLSQLTVGGEARVAFLTPSFHKRFDRLAAFGINPGAELSLHQQKPAFVVRVGETELALDREIADEIYVRPMS